MKVTIYTKKKNISIKVLKDVGMTVPKTSAVYMQKDRDEGSIYMYTARQEMRAYNNNNMRNPYNRRDAGRVTYVMFVACPHPCLATYILLSCCIYTALIPCLAAHILHLFLYFWHCHPYILQHFNGNVLLSCFTGFLLYRNSCMAYYVSIKAYNSTVQECCAVQYVKALWACQSNPYIESLLTQLSDMYVCIHHFDYIRGLSNYIESLLSKSLLAKVCVHT